jgi:hypothetical protein
MVKKTSSPGPAAKARACFAGLVFSRLVFSGLVALGSGKAHVASAAPAATAPIVTDGRAAATIVVPDQPGSAVETAVDELVRFVGKATGVKLPVVRESDFGKSSGGTVISIGSTRLVGQAGLPANQQPGEFFAVRWRGDTVFLLGNDSLTTNAIEVWPGGGRRPPAGQAELFLGSLDATVWFIENCLGGGYLFPGENGTSYPYGPSLAATRAEKELRTPYLLRSLRNFSAGADFRRIAPTVLAPKAQAQRRDDVARWMFLRGLGYPRAMLKSGHAFTDWYETYKDSDPDIFARFPDGHWGIVPASPFFQYHHPHWVKFCEANPKVARFTLEGMRTFFAENPESLTFCVAQNDGRWDGFCVCKECKKMDDPQACPVNLRYARQTGERYEYPYVYLTDRYAKTWLRLGETAALEFPGKYLMAYAYGALDKPPRSTKLPDNLLIQYVPTVDLMDTEKAWVATTLGTWDEWVNAGAKLIYRPNLHYAGASLPLVYARRLARELAHFHASGLLGVDYDQLPANFGSQGINHYVLSRVIFEPGLDPGILMDEFCRKAYGPAAEPMRCYYALLEQETERAMNERWKTWGKSFAEALDQPDHVKKIEALFREAVGRVRADSDDRARVDMAFEAWQYARLFARVGTPENNTALLTFLNRHKNSMVVDFVWLADRGLIRGIQTGEMNLASHLRLINTDRSVGGAAKGGSTDGE